MIKELNKNIKLLKDFFIKEFPRKKRIIDEGLFYISLILWTDNSFNIILSHGFQRNKKLINYQVEKKGLNICKKIIEDGSWEKEGKIIKEDSFILKRGKIIPKKDIIIIADKKISFNKNIQKKDIIKDLEEGLLEGIFVKSQNQYTKNVINIYTIHQAEMILNKIYQSDNLKRDLKKAFKKSFK